MKAEASIEKQALCPECGASWRVLQNDLETEPLGSYALDQTIALIEETLINHSKNLIAILEQFDFLTLELLKHRIVESKKPPKNMPALIAQIEPIEGMAHYCLDAINRLFPLQEKLEAHLMASKRKYKTYGTI